MSALFAAKGYRSAVTSFSTECEKDVAEKCAVAVLNTSRLILSTLGLSADEIRAAVDAATWPSAIRRLPRIG